MFVWCLIRCMIFNVSTNCFSLTKHGHMKMSQTFRQWPWNTTLKFKMQTFFLTADYKVKVPSFKQINRLKNRNTGKDTYNIKRLKNKDWNSLTDYTDLKKNYWDRHIIFKRKDSVGLLMYLISFSFLRYSHCPCTVLPSMLRVGSMLVLPSRKNRSGRTETFCLRMTYSYPPVLFC